MRKNNFGMIVAFESSDFGFNISVVAYAEDFDEARELVEKLNMENDNKQKKYQCIFGEDIFLLKKNEATIELINAVKNDTVGTTIYSKEY